MRRFLALLLLLPAFALQVAVTAPADAVVVAGFEVDGDTPDDGAVSGVDWGTPVGRAASDPVGNVDTTTFKSSKEFEHPSTWVQGTGLAPNQDDISDVYFHDATVDGDIWGYVGFRRLTTSGTTNFDVELNKLPNAVAEDFMPVRSVGDVMVRFEQDGNSAFALTAAWSWTRTASPDWGAGCIEVPGYTPGAGWCAEPVASIPFTGVTGESGHFAEGAFNVSALLRLQNGDEVTCAGGDFGTMNIRSFTGNADESALKDYVEPLAIGIADTCGELEIHKLDQFGGAAAGATFSISPNPVPGQDTSPLVVTDGGANDPDAQADGVIAFDPATPGTYTVVETAAPAGHELVEPVSARTWTLTVTQEGSTWTGPGDTGEPGEAGALVVSNRRYFVPPTILNVPTYDRDHDWLVTKAVAGASTENVPEGTTASFEYVVRLRALDPTAADYSDFVGTVTLTNPNALDMVVTLSTGITGGAACTIDDAALLDVSDAPGFQVRLDEGADELTYTCPAAALPGGTTATATWAEEMYPSSDVAETYSRSDATAFTVDQRTDETTTVTDVFDEDATTARSWGPFTWSTVRASDVPAAHTVVVATYTRDDIEGVAGTCTSHPNTVSLSADPSTDTETVTVCVGRDLDVTHDADLGYERELLWRIAKGGPGTVFTGVDGDGNLQRTVRYTIDVTADGMTDSAWALTGTIEVDNPNEWDVTGTISDTVVVDGRTSECDLLSPDVAGAAGHQVTVPAGSVDHAITYECNGVTQGAYVGENTVTFDYSADSHEYPDVDDTDSHETTVTVTGDPMPSKETVTITDLLDGNDVTASLPQRTFEWTTVNAMADQTQRIDVDVPLGTTEDACTPHRNVVSIDGLTYEGTSDDHTVTVCSPGLSTSVVADYGRKQLWGLTKEVDRTSVEVGPDGAATFDYTVTATPGQVVPDGTSSWTGVVAVHNPSTTEPLTVSLTDTPSVPGWTGCAFTGDATDLLLAAGASEQVPYACTGTGSASGTHTATATFGGQTVDETVPVTFAPRPGITDSTTTLTDDIPNDGLPALEHAVDAAGGVHVLTYARRLGAPAGACETYTNTAVLALTGEDLVARRTVQACEEAPLDVAVTAGGDLVRAYAWSVTKVADATERTVDPATGKATFRYTVEVRAGASSDSGWQLRGTATLSNPNRYADGDITAAVTAATDLGGGATCSVTGGRHVVVPEDDEVTLPVVCTFTSQPAGTGGLVVTATWDPAGEAVTATDSAATPVAVAVRSETNEVVDVIDDKAVPGQRVVLAGDLVWEPGLVRTYTYDLAVAGGPAGQCATHTNTAVVDLADGTGPSATATVRACTPPAEVLPVQASGKAVGSVSATCQGTVRARLVNRTGDRVVYTLRVGQTTHRVAVRAGTGKKHVTRGPARARVVLRAQGEVLDRVRVPHRCAPPEVLPDTGLRATSR